MARAPRKPETAPPPGTRHVPKQERSKKRLEAIVEAAAQLFAEADFPTVTMEAIAQRAGTPIGSVYQFFEDKRAIFAAVMARSNQRAREVLDVVLRQAEAAEAGVTSVPLPVLLEAVIDAYVLLQRSDPAIRAANRNLTYLGELVAEDEALQRQLAMRTAALLGAYYPRSEPRIRKLVATTVVDVVTSLLVLADRRDTPTARKQLEECKTMVRLYVEARLGT
ncbi:MAG: TetR/AcrR family transcriptional regulator [Sandaracinaceae bacterium]